MTLLPKSVLTLAALMLAALATQAQGPAGKYFDRETAEVPFFDEWYLAEDDEDGLGGEQLQELLNELAEHPMNLNTASREDLERLPFLTARQTEDLQEYVYRYGPMRSMNELTMVRSIDFRTRQMLYSVAFVDSIATKPPLPSLKDILKRGRSEMVTAASIPFYKRLGDRNGYLGYPYKFWTRYQFRYGPFVKAGVVAAQDAGEPFFANRNSSGFDYASPYLLLQKWGRLKALALGRYRVHMGLGLAMNNDFSMGKVGSLQGLGRQTNTIRAHSSRLASNYLQGAAATVEVIKGLDLTAFFSHRNIDATLNSDGTIATILTSGYHRTQSEMDRKHNARQNAMGTHLSYFNKGFLVGLTAVQTSFNTPLQPDTRQQYRQYYAMGKSFWNASVDYGYRSYFLTFAGETATGGCKAVATLNTLSLRLTSCLTLTALQRFYSYRYNALFANSFSDGGHIQDESGVYVGAQWTPTRRLTMAGYADVAYAPWPRYMISKASYSHDYLATAAYQWRQFTLTGRYRLRLRQRDNGAKTALISHNEQRARVALSYEHGRWMLKTQADMAVADMQKRSLGWMMTENIAYDASILRFGLTAGYFHTDDYNSRVYTYERGMLYMLNFPMFYGKGLRTALFFQLNASKNLHFIGKIGNTHYFDRTTIGTALQQINGRNKTDLDLQLRWKF